MVNDLKRNNSGSSISLDLSALGEAGEQSIGVETEDKPVIMNPISATIVGVDLKINTNQIQTNKDDESKKFYRAIFTVETKFIHPETKEEVTSKDNYSGLRFYPKVNEDGSFAMDANGQPVLDHFWSGETSYFGRLLALVQDVDDKVLTYGQFFAFFTPGKQVTIKTEFPQYNGQTSKKQVIQSFL